MLKYILDRLKERSTWLGITALLSVAGLKISPDQGNAIATAGAAIASAIMIFTADMKK